MNDSNESNTATTKSPAETPFTSAEGFRAYARCRGRSATTIEGDPFLVGVNKKGEAIAAISPGDETGDLHLTIERHKAIVERARGLGCTGPVHIFASANGGPNGSSSYRFVQYPTALFDRELFRSALCDACRFGRRQALAELVGANPDECFSPRVDLTPLMLAAAFRRVSCVRFLIPRSDLGAKMDNGQTALMAAASVGATDCVKALLAAGPSLVDCQDAAGKTALMLAAERGRAECAVALLPKSNVLLTDTQGRTALAHAVASGCEESIEAIGRHVATLEAKALRGELALRAHDAGRNQLTPSTPASVSTAAGVCAVSPVSGLGAPRAARRL